ncbi:MAG: PIN domain-containing protein [Deltaproteobacteria bacterium]|nr:PIN domain-containing protein [Deltaproteobacteria bacterium]
MIYLDTSVALAELFAEDHKAPDPVWASPLISSRLLEYEIWTRVHARHADKTHGDAARELLSRVSFVELVPPVLCRALEPFPVPVRTLDALHLATLHYLVAAHEKVTLATFDDRMRRASAAMGLALAF